MRKRNIYNLIITITIILVILFILLDTTKNTIALNKLSNMYKDIDVLEDKIAIYYLDNGIIPIKSKIEGFKQYSVNPNDNSNYYEIDLDKLENINLYYGKKINGENDIYIINEQSHTIYYYKGIKYKKHEIYSKELDYKNVDIENY